MMKRFSAFCFLAALDVLCGGVASPRAEECKTQQLFIPQHSVELIHDYAQKNASTEETFSIAGIGNEYGVLGTDYKSISAQKLAVLIMGDKKFENAQRVRLDWPYSTRGTAPFAHELSAILHKPVIGYPGPLWWYPDGTIISASPDNVTFGGPTQANVAQCSTSDGKDHTPEECKPVIAAHDNAQAVFGNIAFAISCNAVQRAADLSDQGDRAASTKLAYYYAFIDRDEVKERNYETRASINLWPSDQ